MKTNSLLVLLLITIGASSITRAQNAFAPIDMSSVDNFDVRVGNSAWGFQISSYPGGNVNFAGVPFSIPASGNTCWNAHVWNSGTVTMDLPTQVDFPVAVHTLISTIGGQYGPASYAYIEFFGSKGADYKVDLVGGVHIRDWYQDSSWTTTLTWSNATPRVWTASPAQIDVQHFVLPAEFSTQRLTGIRLVDSGHVSFQRCFINAVTVESLVSPSITQQPASQVVRPGSLVTFSVQAAGQPLPGYQWQFNGTDIPGATNVNYVIPSANIGNIGSFDVIVYYSVGTNVSATATLSLLDIRMFPGLILNGPIGGNYDIQAVSAIGAGTNWITLTNVTLTAAQPYIFIDYASLTNNQQLYRAVPR